MATTPGQWIHMVGIAGAGMSGIAKILSEQGFKVSGSDLQTNTITQKLEELGIKIYQGHSSSNIKEGVDLLVVSSAIPQDNSEVQSAKQKNIPIIKRGQMLAKLVNDKKGIAVAGAHGKTTTTSMIFSVLSECGVDPTFVVGGELQDSHLNAKLGSCEYFVVEADESDASFLELRPYIAVVTNIEDDHMDYYKSFSNILKAFHDFIDGVRPDGFALLYGEDKYIQMISRQTDTKVILYGEDQSNDYYLEDWQADGMGSKFKVYQHNKHLGEVEVSVPGKHNALNALATIAAAMETGIEFDKIKQAIRNFHGTKRRFQVLGETAGITVVDDYAHHPTEIKATLAAARNLHKKRLIAIFQPHRYSRTRMLGKELGEAFINSDLVIFTEVYAAGEKPIPGINGELVYEAAKNAGCNAKYIPCFNEIKEYLLENACDQDLIITMGAGDIWKIGIDIVRELGWHVPQS